MTLVVTATAAETPAPDRSAYTLFNPTPRAEMREMVTDRPDKTESPFTVDAGHLQVEMDLVSFTSDRHNPERADVRFEEWAVANTNFRLGLCDRAEFDLIVPTYTSDRTRDVGAGNISRSRGFGDLTLRMKVNVWGNNGGSTAFGLIPFVKLPTNQDGLGNNAVEGGLILPLAIELPGEWGLGVMTEVDFNENSDDSNYHAEWINSVTLSHAIVGNLGGYVEFFSLVSNERHTPWIGTFDCGLTYAVTKNIQLDAGVNIGLTRAADDVNVFAGLSWRF